MASIEYMPQEEPQPRQWQSPMTGQTITGGAPTMATEEQNTRVRMILEALKQGVAPNVPNAGGLTPVYGPQPGGAPIEPGTTPFELSGYRSQPQQQASPGEQKNRLLDALRANPAQTIQAMTQLSQQLKGVPQQMQDQIYQGLGLSQPKQPNLTPTTVAAAASGVPGQGIDRTQAQAILDTQARQAAATAAAKERIQAEVKGNTPLGEKAKFYYNAYGEVAKSSMTANQAEQEGYTPRTTDQIKQINPAQAAYFATARLRPLVDKILVKVNSQVDKLPWHTKFWNIQKNRVAIDMLKKAGDPDVREFEQLVQTGLIEYLQALGIPGGREGLGLINRMQVEFPNSADSAEAAKRLLDNIDDAVQFRSGVLKSKKLSKQVRFQGKDGVWYLKMGEDFYVDPQQGK